MRALVISDIHGNLHALRAVLDAAGRFDQLWNLGDTVGYGANPNEVIEILREQATVNVRGNHDRACAGLSDTHSFNPVAAQAAAWTKANLTQENLLWLQTMPKGPVPASERATCAHGSPLHEDQYILSMRDAWTPLQRMQTPVTFFGHTHVQGSFAQQGAEWEEVHPVCDADGECRLLLGSEARYLVNPGSVGQPRDLDPRAAFAIYDTAMATSGDTATRGDPGTGGDPSGVQATEAGCVIFRRVVYDVAGAQAAIRAAGLPDRLASRLDSGR